MISLHSAKASVHVRRGGDPLQVVPYKIPRRCAATYYPETNVLVSVRSVADRSNQPASKSVRITLTPSVSQHVEMTGP